VQSKASSVNAMYIQADGAMAPIATAGGVEHKEKSWESYLPTIILLARKQKKMLNV
jgi:hypothetical protein